MVLKLTCSACGTLFTPSRADLLLGPHWYGRCPDRRFHQPSVMRPMRSSRSLPPPIPLQPPNGSSFPSWLGSG